jgi:signal transduction histidine kinase
MAASLEQSQDSRRALTADIAHELRTPLAVQRAQLEALQDGVYPLTTENLASALDQNLTLARLVDDLRMLALADSGALKLERAPTDLHTLTSRLVERFRPSADARHIALSLESIPASSLKTGRLTADRFTVSLDPLRVEQIIANLLSNALRHTPDGGRIVVRLGAQAGRLRLDVLDSGPGISPEALPHIFERFYRADRSRSRSEGGAGLGLAIARRLAELHGGVLEAANRPEGGAVFTLTLPAE